MTNDPRDCNRRLPVSYRSKLSDLLRTQFGQPVVPTPTKSTKLPYRQECCLEDTERRNSVDFSLTTNQEFVNCVIPMTLKLLGQI